MFELVVIDGKVLVKDCFKVLFLNELFFIKCFVVEEGFFMFVGEKVIV